MGSEAGGVFLGGWLGQAVRENLGSQETMVLGRGRRGDVRRDT
jgi:hypothetical protein